MKTIKVIPQNDGKQRTNWYVQVSGRTVSQHRKKSRAKQKARQKASSGDRIIIRRTDGTIQDQTTVRG